MSCLYRDYRRVEGFEDYIVSNYGEVFSTRHSRVRELKNQPSGKHGYFNVTLYNNKIKCTRMVHILVGNAFVGKRQNKMEFDHIDRNPVNNCADNLRLATRSEQNINVGVSKNNKLREKNICSYTKNEHHYWIIQIERNYKTVFRRQMSKNKYSLNDAIKVRDDFLTSSAK